MLLPNKHIRLADSLIGLGSFVLEALEQPKSIDALWKEFKETVNSKHFPAHHSFENLILAVDFLYSIGAVVEDKHGRLTLCG